MDVRNWITSYKLTYKDSLFSIQILLIAFGALITVPVLTGLDPNVALFTAGAGTLIFHFVTNRVIPVFLASSFAYTAPILVATKTWGIPAALGGLAVAGLVYMAIGGIIQWRGRKFITTLFPPVVVGPVIMVIGLMLAPVAVSMALGKANPEHLIPEKSALLIAMTSLAASVSVFLFTRGTLKLIPILCGLAAGYLVSIPFGVLDFSVVSNAPWIAFPGFVIPEFKFDAIVFLVPAAVVPIIVHFGDMIAIGEVTENDFLKDPGVHRTLLGNGVATTFAACIGGPPLRINAEVTGTVVTLKRFEPSLMVWAALFAILLAFFGKLGALLQTIPSPATGGILIILFGSLVVVGINCLKKNRTQLMDLRNLLIVALILVFGIGGITFSAGAFTLKGVGLAALAGVILNLILPDKNAAQES
ncbi:MAG: uracil-xanthine permease family protein [Desulfobacterales bacterium]|jgi:uracil permease